MSRGPKCIDTWCSLQTLKIGFGTSRYRNVMDMNAFYGGFAAGLMFRDDPVWVMNVVPTSGPNTLSAIYDRGLIGVAHDWLVFQVLRYYSRDGLEDHSAGCSYSRWARNEALFLSILSTNLGMCCTMQSNVGYTES